MKSTSLRLTLLVVVCLGFVALAGSSASAAFPGQNGKIAFLSWRDGNSEIYVTNPDASGQTNLTNSTEHDADPSFSPDGAKIAFYRNELGLSANNEIYVMNSDGSGRTRLTKDPDNDVWRDYQPAFSHDGTKIAFRREHTDFATFKTVGDIYIMNAADADGDGNGDNRINLTNKGANDQYPAFSPDGTKIAFASVRDNNTEIYVMNADGSGQTNLTNNAAGDTMPTFSPDGSKIVFASAREDSNFEIWVMNSDGTNPVRLTNNTAGDYDPAFSPDGQKITFTSERDGGQQEIYVMNADGSNPIRLTNHSAMDSQPDWGVAPQQQPPTVFSVNPSEGQTGVSRTTNITVTFSEAMETNSFDENTIKLTRGTTPIPFTMTTSTDGLGRTVLTLDPFGPTTQKLGKRKTYTVTVEGTNPAGDSFAVKDLAGNDLAEDKVWTFRTKRR